MNEKIYMIDNIKFYYKKVGEYFVVKRGEFSAKDRDLYTACIKAIYKEAFHNTNQLAGSIKIPKIKIKGEKNE